MKTKIYRIPILLFLIATVSLACLIPSREEEEEPVSSIPPAASIPEDGLLRQWATRARASSEYGNPDWAASQAVGAPDVEICEDSVNAWASASSNTEEWIELTYATPVYPSEINIHMSYNPSQVVEVQIIDVNDKPYSVMKAEPVEVSECPHVLGISFDQGKKILVNRVKIFVDQSVLGLGWNEIDAVELVGQPGDGEVPPPSEPQSVEQPRAGVESPYQPGELEAGYFAYDVTGYENDTIKGNRVQYQSTPNTYVVGLISETERYVVSLFLPTAGLAQGPAQLIPYDETVATKELTAAIYINAFLYIADSGGIEIQSDPAGGELTGVFSFDAHSKDFADRSVVVAGAVKEIPLK